MVRPEAGKKPPPLFGRVGGLSQQGAASRPPPPSGDLALRVPFPTGGAGLSTPPPLAPAPSRPPSPSRFPAPDLRFLVSLFHSFLSGFSECPLVL